MMNEKQEDITVFIKREREETNEKNVTIKVKTLEKRRGIW